MFTIKVVHVYYEIDVLPINQSPRQWAMPKKHLLKYTIIINFYCGSYLILCKCFFSGSEKTIKFKN